jgi:hypothetical protein
VDVQQDLLVDGWVVNFQSQVVHNALSFLVLCKPFPAITQSLHFILI